MIIHAKFGGMPALEFLIETKGGPGQGIGTACVSGPQGEMLQPIDDARMQVGAGGAVFNVDQPCEKSAPRVGLITLAWTRQAKSPKVKPRGSFDGCRGPDRDCGQKW